MTLTHKLEEYFCECGDFLLILSAKLLLQQENDAVVELSVLHLTVSEEHREGFVRQPVSACGRGMEGCSEIWLLSWAAKLAAQLAAQLAADLRMAKMLMNGN